MLPGTIAASLSFALSVNRQSVKVMFGRLCTCLRMFLLQVLVPLPVWTR